MLWALQKLQYVTLSPSQLSAAGTLIFSSKREKEDFDSNHLGIYVIPKYNGHD